MAHKHKIPDTLLRCVRMFAQKKPRHVSVQGFRTNSRHPQYDVTRDDQRFVMIRHSGAGDARELIVVENFFEELKAKVGN